MSIPNIPSLYQKIGKGAEGGLEFARVMNLLLIADAKERNYQTIAYSDASGDYKGVDCIIRSQNSSTGFRNIGVQYKFVPSNLSGNHKRDIIASLERALNAFPEMSGWVLLTPEDFLKNDMEWFEKVQAEYEVELIPGTGFKSFKIEQWGHTTIAHMMLQNPSVGKHYYGDELFRHELNTLTLAHIAIDSEECNWAKGGDDTFIYQFTDFNESRSSEPVFDFHFINNTSTTCLLNEINIVIEETWTEVKGIRKDEILKSIGTIQWDIDFNKAINTIDITAVEGGPIVFRANEPKRFSIQLNQFARNCPGNMAGIHFDFVFTSTTIRSKSLTLSF